MLRDLKELTAEVGPWAAITLYVYAWMWHHYLSPSPRTLPANTAEHVDETPPSEPLPAPRTAAPRR